MYMKKWLGYDDARQIVHPDLGIINRLHHAQTGVGAGREAHIAVVELPCQVAQRVDGCLNRWRHGPVLPAIDWFAPF
jgi:hypothetical protein